jgi:hypothetical protein
MMTIGKRNFMRRGLPGAAKKGKTAAKCMQIKSAASGPAAN